MFLVGLAGFAVVGGAYAFSQPPYSVETGAIDGLLSVAWWARAATFVVALVTRDLTPAAREPLRSRRRVAGGTLAVLVVVGVVVAGVHVATYHAQPPVTAAETPAAQAYLTAHHTCLTSPQVDTTMAGRVACRTGDGVAELVQVIPPVSGNEVAFNTAIAGLRKQAATRGLVVNYQVVSGWQPDFDLLDVTGTAVG